MGASVTPSVPVKAATIVERFEVAPDLGALEPFDVHHKEVRCETETDRIPVFFKASVTSATVMSTSSSGSMSTDGGVRAEAKVRFEPLVDLGP